MNNFQFQTPNPNPFGQQFSFGQPSFNNSSINNNIELVKLPNSLRSDNFFSALDNQGNLFTSSRGMQTINLPNPIETELIRCFATAFSKNSEQIIASMTNPYKSFSQNIRKILIEKAESNEQFKPYLFQFSIFDFFIVNSNNLPYMFRIRNELIYKVCAPDISNFNLFKLGDITKKTTIEIQIHKITFLLLICDFSQAIPFIQSLIESLEHSQDNSIRSNYQEYIDFFMNLGRLCEYYSHIIKESDTTPSSAYGQVNLNMDAMAKEITQEMERIIKGIKTNSPLSPSSINPSLVSILFLLKGDTKAISILLKEKGLNWYFTLLCHIFYRGGSSDFFDSLKQTLKTIQFNPEENLEKDLVNMIVISQTNQLEAVKGIKGKVPFVLYFAMLSILNDMELIYCMDDSIDIYKYEYTEFLNYLFNQDISLNDFIAYFFAYIDTNENSNMIFIHNFAVKKIEEVFMRDLSNDDIKKQIDAIKLSLKRFQMTKESSMVIDRICFNNYLRLNEYKECIQAYLEYNKVSNEVGSSGISISDCVLCERDDLLDEVMALILNGGKWEPFREVSSWLSEKKDLPVNVDFLWRYIDYQLRLKGENENLNKVINEFFGFCFVKQPYPGCPAMLWLFILNQIKEVSDINGLSLIKEHVATALDNLLLYESAIKRRMRQFLADRSINLDELFEKLTDFLFDQKTNMSD